MHTFSLELAASPDQGGDVIITRIPNLLRPLRGPVLLAKNMPPECVVPAGVRGLIIKDVILLTLEVLTE
jgi:hypothetical protein